MRPGPACIAAVCRGSLSSRETDSFPSGPRPPRGQAVEEGLVLIRRLREVACDVLIRGLRLVACDVAVCLRGQVGRAIMLP